MTKTQQYEIEIATLSAQLNNLSEIVARLSQSGPNVTGRASALVALAKDARLDGRVGAGDVTVAVMLAGGGLAIGVCGALTVHLGSMDVVSASEAVSLGGLTGCGLGLARLGIDALGLPAAASWFLDWVHDTVVDAIAARSGIVDDDQDEPESTREIPVFNRGEQAGFVSLPEPTEFAVKTLRIDSVNMADGIREIEVDKVCLFLKSAFATGQWARDRQNILSQKEHADVSRYLKARGWWEIKDSPTLHRACSDLRNRVTNGTARTGTNGVTDG